MKTNTTVTPNVGHYVVCTVHRYGLRTYHVTKEKRCTCGGTVKRPCPHIRAVTDHLRAGGKRAPEAPEEHPTLRLRETRQKGPLSGTPTAAPLTCPICGTPVEQRSPDLWRCPKDASHYWQWRGERNGGAIRKFLTQPHPNKQGAFYEMTREQRHAFLVQAARRLHAGGHTSHV